MPGKVEADFPSGIASSDDSEPVHISRPNVFQREATWRITPDALTREGGERAKAPLAARLARLLLRIMFPWGVVRIERGGPARFAYADIVELRLSFDPTRFDSKRHRCEITMRDRTRTNIWSTHYVSVGDFEDRGATYAPLARALIARVAAANPHCVFRAGKRPLVYWAEHTFLLAMSTLAVFTVGVLGGSAISELVWVKIGIVITMIPLALVYARKNRPRHFDPSGIPGDILP